MMAFLFGFPLNQGNTCTLHIILFIMMFFFTRTKNHKNKNTCIKPFLKRAILRSPCLDCLSPLPRTPRVAEPTGSSIKPPYTSTRTRIRVKDKRRFQGLTEGIPLRRLSRQIFPWSERSPQDRMLVDFPHVWKPAGDAHSLQKGRASLAWGKESAVFALLSVGSGRFRLGLSSLRPYTHQEPLCRPWQNAVTDFKSEGCSWHGVGSSQGDKASNCAAQQPLASEAPNVRSSCSKKSTSS